MRINLHQSEDRKLGYEANSEIGVTATAISHDLKVFARQRWPLANDKYRKDRLAGLLGFTKRRIRSFYEGEETAVPRTRETDAIERLIGKRIGADAELEEAQHEYRNLAQLASSLQALLYGPHASFYRPQVDAIRAALLGEGLPAQGRGRDDGARDHERAGDG